MTADILLFPVLGFAVITIATCTLCASVRRFYVPAVDSRDEMEVAATVVVAVPVDRNEMELMSDEHVEIAVVVDDDPVYRERRPYPRSCS